MTRGGHSLALLLALCLGQLGTAEARKRRRHRSVEELVTPAPAPASPAAPPSASPPGNAPPPPAEPEPEPLPLEPDPAPLQPDAPGPAATPAPSTDGGGDVVEVIDAGTGPAPSSTSAAAAAPAPSPDSFTFTGWARARLSVGLTSTGADAADPTAVPFDRLTAQGQLHVRLRYARGRRFEAVASGLLSAALWEQDARPPDTFNLFNGDTRSGYEATLREAQVGFFFPRFDLRIGQQRIPWGRGDAFTPNDVVNAYDLRDQFMNETEVVRIPTFALRGDLTLGPVLIQAVVAPFFQPNRYDSYGANWSLLQPDAPVGFRTLASQATSSAGVSTTLYPLLQPLLQQTALPPANFAGTAAGLRFGLALGRIDLDAYYHYGYDPAPAISVSSAFSALLAQATSTDQVTLLLLSGIKDGSVDATYQRRHHAGLSFAAPLGPLLLRGDFAADSLTILGGADLQSLRLPTVQAVLGLEYQRGELGKALALEAHYLHVVNSPGDSAFLLQRTDNVSLAALARWSFLRDHLQLELRAIAGLRPLSYVLRPQVSLIFGGFDIRLGALLLGGEDSSFGAYYRRNLMLFTMARYSF